MIKAIYEAGYSQHARLIILLSFMVVELIIVGILAKKMKISKPKMLLLYAGVSIFGMVMAVLISTHQVGKNPFSPEFLKNELMFLPITMLHMFIPVALVSAPAAKLIGLDVRKSQDIFGSVYMFYQGAGHISCVFFGCCNGYQSDFGIYNPYLGVNTFPVQIFDCLSCLIIFAAYLWYLKKNDYDGKGLLFPLTLIVYGVVRFLWEFARNNTKLWLGLSYDSFHSIAMIAVGALYLWIICSYNRAESAKREAALAKKCRRAKRR